MCSPAYNRLRRRQMAYGRWQPRVGADEARAHVERLLGAGLRKAHVAALAGVSKATVVNVTRPDTERISADIERALLAVEVPERVADVAEGNARVPIVGARRRVQALVAFGYPQSNLARELGIDPSHATFAALVQRRLPVDHTGQTISAKRERAIKALFDRLQLTPGPSQRARDYGRKRGWALPFEWDETALDDPRGRPQRGRWTPPTRTERRDARREQVAALTAQGLSADQIAERLGITARTVVRDRSEATTTEPAAVQRDSEIEVMGEVAVQARRDIAGRRAAPTYRRERTR
ncbi:helix-turn-helix domain-containing protein [Nocardia barduliensis]|uniref:helix-turn-helix domain-containing protein n=1 Tax=Nocardia barduliensis TaxID=2736643 RepID=UPI0015720696|nr:helix-turn-helix domain-containing protein [Nocardia barduliensis]